MSVVLLREHGPECQAGPRVVHLMSRAHAAASAEGDVTGCCIGCRRVLTNRRVVEEADCPSCVAERARMLDRYFWRSPFDTEVISTGTTNSRQGEKLFGWGRR